MKTIMMNGRRISYEVRQVIADRRGILRVRTRRGEVHVHKRATAFGIKRQIEAAHPDWYVAEWTELVKSPPSGRG